MNVRRLGEGLFELYIPEQHVVITLKVDDSVYSVLDFPNRSDFLRRVAEDLVHGRIDPKSLRKPSMATRNHVISFRATETVAERLNKLARRLNWSRSGLIIAAALHELEVMI